MQCGLGKLPGTGLAPGGSDYCESVTAEFGSTSMFDILSHLAGKTETELKSVMVKAVC